MKKQTLIKVKHKDTKEIRFLKPGTIEALGGIVRGYIDGELEVVDQEDEAAAEELKKLEAFTRTEKQPEMKGKTAYTAEELAAIDDLAVPIDGSEKKQTQATSQVVENDDDEDEDDDDTDDFWGGGHAEDEELEEIQDEVVEGNPEGVEIQDEPQGEEIVGTEEQTEVEPVEGTQLALPEEVVEPEEPKKRGRKPKAEPAE